MTNKVKKQNGLLNKVRKAIIKLLENKEDDSGQKELQYKGAEIRKDPGLDCPKCHYRINITMEMLLSQSLFHCPNCKLELTLDYEKSRACLDALKKVATAIEKIEASKQQSF